MLDRMTEQYCTGDSEETSKTETVEGYPNKTCRKALQVFYATCNERGWDYSKPMPKEKVREHFTAIMPFQVFALTVQGLCPLKELSKPLLLYQLW